MAAKKLIISEALLVRTSQFIELVADNIMVNAICPGPVVTDMLGEAAVDPTKRAELAASAPLGGRSRASSVRCSTLPLRNQIGAPARPSP